MTDEIIDSVVAKTGLERDKAHAAVDAVLDYFRENPDKVRVHVEVSKVDFKGLIGDAQKRAKPLVEKGKQAAGTAKEKVGPVATQGAGMAKDQAKKAQVKIKDLSSRNKNGASEFDDAEDAVKEAASSES